MLSRNLPLPALCLAAASTLVAATLVAGCNAHPIKPVDFDNSAVSVESLPLDVNKKVDVLLVLDNSSSMGEEQANLAANFAPFIERLEAAGADYRIAITTTDRGGPVCGAPDGGVFALSSCLDRPERFVSPNGAVDKFEAACVAQCSLADAELALTPTAVEPGGAEAVRPWIQSHNGVSNLPDGVDPLEAFACFAPQGISGCGWESPLEAIASALNNMLDPDRPEHGFLRDDALLAVLIVTDEADCSYNRGLEHELFFAETFQEPGAGLSSAVCWNAGVACSGDSPYADCVDVERDVSGAETSDPDQAVLRPVSRYVELLEGVAATKLDGREVLVSLIAGVPQGYASGEAELVYADSPDAEFQADFGIGAGCQNEVDGELQTAVPPVRLRTFAEAFVGAGIEDGARNIYSVCASDYTPAISDIVRGIEVELPPACFPACVLDLDDSTEALDYSCEVTEEAGGSQRGLPACELGASGYALPEGADACWIAKTGAELDPDCAADHRNLEFELLRQPGVEVPGDVVVSAACELSSFPSVDCG